MYWKSSPRLWGCFYVLHRGRGLKRVFPTPVGVFPMSAAVESDTKGLPHACGGVSDRRKSCYCTVWSSPRLWGCFCRARPSRRRAVVFPTPVGVFLMCGLRTSNSPGLPHACGGVSINDVKSISAGGSSPRLWGCFFRLHTTVIALLVFPTPVGVFLRLRKRFDQVHGLPHACGGVSRYRWTALWCAWSSPRLWGCFYRWDSPPSDGVVFPTPVGVFLLYLTDATHGERLPHACGGVSRMGRSFMLPPRSSPRLWGCFHHGLQIRHLGGVFPTPVGVFLTDGKLTIQVSGLPHACGGVSVHVQHNHFRRQSSPRLWGCFRFISRRRMEWRVFPTLPYFLKMNSLRMVLVVARDRFCGRRGSLTLKAKLS